jgi:hypothetical protein
VSRIPLPFKSRNTHPAISGASADGVNVLVGVGVEGGLGVLVGVRVAVGVGVRVAVG